MSVLQRTEPDPAGESSRPARALGSQALGALPGVALAALAGAVSVLVGMVLVAIPTVLAWVADNRSTASLWQAVGASVDVWALAHRAEVEAPGVRVVLAPLLLTAVLVAVCWYAARQVLLGPAEEGVDGRVGGLRGALTALGAQNAAAFVLAYAASAVVLANAAGVGLAPVRLLTLVPGALLVPALGVAAVWLQQHRRADHPGVAAALRWMDARTPVIVQRAVPAAAEVLVGLSAVGLLVVLGLLLLRGSRVLTLYSALDAGVVGTVVLTLTQLAALPNLVVWALSWLTGAGLGVGSVHVGWARSTAGDLPLLPVLGALPEPGVMPPGLWAMALVPVVAGAWVGHRALEHSTRLTSWLTKAKIALLSAALVTLAALLVGWLASGGLTPGRLGTVGVVPWRFAGLLGLEVAAGALAWMSAGHLRGRRIR